MRERRTSDVSDIFLSPEAYKATQAVEFIAEHLRNEDEYVQVSCSLMILTCFYFYPKLNSGFPLQFSNADCLISFEIIPRG